MKLTQQRNPNLTPEQVNVCPAPVALLRYGAALNSVINKQ